MPALQWKQISASDQEYCQQFVKIMQFMDGRYGILTSSQFQEWLQGDSGPYVGQQLAAFCGFLRPEDVPYASRMQFALLGRYKAGESLAHLMMLGWTPTTSQCEPDFLDGIVDAILAKGVDWLGALSAPVAIKVVSTVRPNSMRYKQAQRLHDRFYARAVANSSASAYIRLARERVLPKAAIWHLQLVA
jgi:hypothetical protein